MKIIKYIFNGPLQDARNFEKNMAILTSRKPGNIMEEVIDQPKENNSVAMAMNILGKALVEDLTPGSYYWGWLSNLACTIMDNSNITYYKSNEIAVKFLDKLIRKEDWAMYESNKKLMEQTKSNFKPNCEDTVTYNPLEMRNFKMEKNDDQDIKDLMKQGLGTGEYIDAKIRNSITRAGLSSIDCTEEGLVGGGATCIPNPDYDKIKAKCDINKKYGQASRNIADIQYTDTDRNVGMCAPVQTPDMVNHPSHYISKCGLESIDVITAFTDGLNGIEATDTGNILKYACRWKNKNGIQDLKKIMWYTQHLINYLEKNKSDTLSIHDGDGNLIGIVKEEK